MCVNEHACALYLVWCGVCCQWHVGVQTWCKVWAKTAFHGFSLGVWYACGVCMHTCLCVYVFVGGGGGGAMIGRVPVHSPKGHLDYFLRYAMTEAIRHQSAAFLYMCGVVNIYIMSVPAFREGTWN